MRPISIKAFLISNLVQFVMAVAIFWFALNAAWDMKKPLALPLIFAVTIIPPSVIAGYVAGRIAARSHVLNGILSSSAWTLFWIYLELDSTVRYHQAPVGVVWPLPYMMALLGAPLLGAVGGLVARNVNGAGAS
jgi:hypothetical protein